VSQLFKVTNFNNFNNVLLRFRRWTAGPTVQLDCFRQVNDGFCYSTGQTGGSGCQSVAKVSSKNGSIAV